MLNKEQAETLAKTLKYNEVDAAAFVAAAIDPAVKEVKLPAGVQIFTDAEVTTLRTNVEAEGYTKGKVAGEEMAVKAVRTAENLEFEGKTVDKLVAAVKTKTLADANIAPDQRLAEKDKTIEKLRTTITGHETKITTLETEKTGLSLDAQLLGYIPANLAVQLGNTEVLGLVKGQYQFVRENDVIVAKQNGVTVMDNLQQPVPAKDVLTGYLKDRKMLVEGNGGTGGTGGGGRGGGSDRTTVVPQSYAEAAAAWKAEGKNENGSDFQAHIAGLQKENPNFVL